MYAARIQELKATLTWFPFKGSFKGDIDIDVEVEVDVDIDRCFGCLRGSSKSVQVLLNGTEAVRH